MSERVAKSIHISTTATGWMKQTSISNSFFTLAIYVGGGS
jgi:hypothetical protein